MVNEIKLWIPFEEIYFQSNQELLSTLKSMLRQYDQINLTVSNYLNLYNNCKIENDHLDKSKL